MSCPSADDVHCRRVPTAMIKQPRTMEVFRLVYPGPVSGRTVGAARFFLEMPPAYDRWKRRKEYQRKSDHSQVIQVIQETKQHLPMPASAMTAALNVARASKAKGIVSTRTGRISAGMCRRPLLRSCILYQTSISSISLLQTVKVFTVRISELENFIRSHSLAVRTADPQVANIMAKILHRQLGLRTDLLPSLQGDDAGSISAPDPSPLSQKGAPISVLTTETMPTLQLPYRFRPPPRPWNRQRW